MLALLAGLITGYQESKMVTLQLVFLRAAPNVSPLTKNLHEVAMRRHLAGLQDLWNSGKAAAVGPMESSDYEGLAVLTVKSADEAKECFKNDPFVKSGMLTLDVVPWMCENTFRKGREFMDVERIWFGILERPQNAPQYPAEKLAELQKGHMANIQKMADDGLLAAAGPLLAEGKRRGIFVFYAKDLGQITKAVNVDPLIKAKRLEMKLIPWYTSKGTVVQYKKS